MAQGRLANRVALLERQRGVGVPCDCGLCVTILYEDGAVETFTPREPGRTVTAECCPHGRPWPVERVYDLRSLTADDKNRVATEPGERV